VIGGLEHTIGGPSIGACSNAEATDLELWKKRMPRRKDSGRQAECEHKDSKHFAKGLCQKCYNKRQQENPEFRKKRNARERERGKRPDVKQRKREWQAKHHLTTRNHISLHVYNSLLLAQNGVCAICTGSNGRRRLAVDHDHRTGAVRGLLCSQCNCALGIVKESILILRRMIDYLRAR